ncbi:MAG: hypothetical protein J0L91_10800, partial [Burkholderiales bacterium]|nr:hypothetical protein [Burkholderiales bacterium]
MYSIKIMWPRGDDEARFRGRHTGFVCFLRRSDAESALRALDDTDPFACGRRLKLRWGKNILKRVDEEPHGNPLPTSGEPRHVLSAAPGRPLVRVSVPEGLRRDRRIRAVAACVAQNGSSLENVLRERERHNPEFDFLDARGVDHPYYKWRVYAACQGDPDCRRTAPFAMLRGGCLWTVPPLATVPGLSGGEPSQSMAVVPSAVDPNTALAASRADGSARLTAPELEEARRLFRVELSASRRSVCRAMAFCYDKAHAAQHVSELLRDLLSEADADGNGALGESDDDGAAPRPTVVSAETLVSRLYLVSDVLFNAQQPGVRGAFRYRTAVEGFAPDAFAALGRYGRRQSILGHRWTRQHKVLTAVHVVLQAWSKWAVYHGSFLADLQARFDGKDLEGGWSEEDKLETADESQA